MNNKGFGKTEVIAFLFVVLVSFIIVTVLYNQLLNRIDGLPSNQTNDKEINIDNGNESKKASTYSELEQLIAMHSKDYFMANSNDKEIDYAPITTLIQNDYINPVYDLTKSDIECSGYVEYLKTEGKYTTYLKCGNYYQTLGYDVLKETE